MNPKDHAAFDQRALVYALRGDWSEARSDLDEAIKLNPNYADGFSNRALFLATCPHPRHRDGVQGYKDATRACELTEWQSPLALVALAACCAEIGDFASAVKWQKTALEDKEYVKEFGQNGKLLLKHYEAKRPYRTEVQIDPTDATGFIARGDRCVMRGESDKAIKDYDAAIKLDPKNARAFYGRGCARTQKEEYDKAIADFTESLKLDPKHTSSYIDRCVILHACCPVTGNRPSRTATPP